MNKKKNKAKKELIRLMNKGFDMGKITVKSRDEIYDRFHRKK